MNRISLLENEQQTRKNEEALTRTGIHWQQNLSDLMKFEEIALKRYVFEKMQVLENGWEILKEKMKAKMHVWMAVWLWYIRKLWNELRLKFESLNEFCSKWLEWFNDIHRNNLGTRKKS